MIIDIHVLHLQAHLLGMFENVAHVEFHEREYDRILSCISREGEVVKVSMGYFVSSLNTTQFMCSWLSHDVE